MCQKETSLLLREDSLGSIVCSKHSVLYLMSRCKFLKGLVLLHEKVSTRSVLLEKSSALIIMLILSKCQREVLIIYNVSVTRLNNKGWQRQEQRH